MKLSPQTVVPSALLTAVLALLTATFPGTATAATAAVWTGGAEGTLSTAGYGGGATYGVDFKSITAQGISALGFWDSRSDGLGNSSYTVGLWETSSPLTLLASVTISNADALDTSLTVEGGQWRYETIPTVNLTSGKTYTIGFYAPDNMSAADSLVLTYPTVTTASTVSKMNNYRVLSGSGFAFPTNVIDLPVAQVNAILVPEPGSAGLVILGSLMLLGRRRKTKD